MISATLALLLSAPAAAAAPAAPPPEAQPIGFRSHADKASVRLGEPFGYEVEIRHRPEEWYVLHGPPALAPFQADGVRCRRDAGKGEVRTTCSMRLALFALGPVDVPDLAFDADGPAGKARLAVPGPRVTGVGVLDPAVPPDGIAIRDISPPAPLLVPSLRLLWWTLGVAGGAAVAAALARALLRARARRRLVPEPTPAERFARRLAALEAERLPERGRAAEHLARLAEAVREYLGALAGLPALDLTSAELVTAVRQGGDARLDPGGLELFLAEADLVKFARQPAAPEACAAGLEYARGLLERTQSRGAGRAA